MGKTLDAITTFGSIELINHIVADWLKRDQSAIN